MKEREREAEAGFPVPLPILFFRLLHPSTHPPHLDRPNSVESSQEAEGGRAGRRGGELAGFLAVSKPITRVPSFPRPGHDDAGGGGGGGVVGLLLL